MTDRFVRRGEILRVTNFQLLSEQTDKKCERVILDVLNSESAADSATIELTGESPRSYLSAHSFSSIERRASVVSV